MILRLLVVSGKSCGFSGGDHNAERKRFIFPNPQTPFLCSLHNISYSVPPSEGSSVNWSVKCVSDNHNWNILLVLPSDLCFTFTLLFLIKPPLSLPSLIGPITFSSAHRESQQEGGGRPFILMCAPRRLLCSQENSGSIAQFLLEFHFKHSPSGAAQSASLVFSPKDWLGCLEWGGGLGKLILAKINIIWEGNWCNIMELGWEGGLGKSKLGKPYLICPKMFAGRNWYLYQEQIHMCRKGPLCIMQGKGWSNRQQYNIAPQTNTR